MKNVLIFAAGFGIGWIARRKLMEISHRRYIKECAEDFEKKFKEQTDPSTFLAKALAQKDEGVTR